MVVYAKLKLTFKGVVFGPEERQILFSGMQMFSLSKVENSALKKSVKITLFEKKCTVYSSRRNILIPHDFPVCN